MTLKLARLGDGPEIFHTIQGEGPSVGMPAVFIRASRCNLHCVWCDTDHTWNFAGTPWPHEKDAMPGYAKHNKADVTFEITTAEAARRILNLDCPRVVITGGEPLLQQDAFLEMIRLVREQTPDCAFELETNATRIPQPALAAALDQFNVSPKLLNSGMPESTRIVADAMRFFAASEKTWFKFVVSCAADLTEIGMLQTAYQIPGPHILLMPEGRTAAELDLTAPALADLCRKTGFRYSDRLHIRLWGDRRGV